MSSKPLLSAKGIQHLVMWRTTPTVLRSRRGGREPIRGIRGSGRRCTSTRSSRRRRARWRAAVWPSIPSYAPRTFRLALDQPGQAGALQRGRVDVHVLGNRVRLDEAEALLVVVEFHGARIHRVGPLAGMRT